jgi:hypothetical protein
MVVQRFNLEKLNKFKNRKYKPLKIRQNREISRIDQKYHGDFNLWDDFIRPQLENIENGPAERAQTAGRQNDAEPIESN